MILFSTFLPSGEYDHGGKKRKENGKVKFYQEKKNQSD